MTAESTTPTGGNGFKTAIDTIIAPKEAFESLRIAPTWGAAFIITIVLMVIGYFLERPATIHASVATMQHLLATNPTYSSLSDDKKQQILANAQNPNAILNIVFICILPLLASLFNALILLAGSAIAGGSATFKNLWSGSINIAVPTLGLAAVVVGIIAMALGPDHFDSTASLMSAAPNLGMLAPGSQGIGNAFLTFITIFVLWGLGLNVLLMRYTAKVGSAIAWVFPVIITVLGAFCGAELIQVGRHFGG